MMVDGGILAPKYFFVTLESFYSYKSCLPNTKKLSVTESVVVLWSLTMEISCLEEISFALYTIFMDL